MKLSIIITIISWTKTLADPYLDQTLTLCNTPYRVLKRLGRYQDIYKVKNTESQEKAMLKIVNSEAHPSVLAELAAMKALKGEKHTVQLICHQHVTGENFAPLEFLVTERCNEGTLRSKMSKLPKNLEFIQLWNDMANGLLELREKGIIHRNINPANLFIHDGHLKIGGFNLATRAETASPARASSVAYMAPEVLEGGQFDHFSDLWSAGVIFFEWSNKQHPYEVFRGKNARGNFEEMQQNMKQFVKRKQKIISGVSEPARNVVYNLLRKTPSSRVVIAVPVPLPTKKPPVDAKTFHELYDLNFNNIL